MGVWREDCGVREEEAGGLGAEGQGTAAGVEPLAGGCPSGGPVGAAWRLDREVAGVVSSEHCDACPAGVELRLRTSVWEVRGV